MAVANAEIRRARALLIEVRSTWFPLLYANGSYTRLDSAHIINNNKISNLNQYAGNIQLTVPLISAHNWAQTSHADDNIDVSKLSAQDVRREIALATGRAYISVLSQRHILEVSLRAGEAARDHFVFAQARRTGGIGNKIDEVRAAQELANDQAQIAAAQIALAKAREALGVLIGRDGPVDAADEPPVWTAPPLADALRGAEEARTDVRTAKLKVTAAEHTVRDDWTDYMPLLSAVLQPFYNNPPTLAQPISGWSASLILSIPLYDGGLRYGQARERAALATEAHANLDAALLQARSDVRIAFEEILRTDEALQAARDSSRLAHEALDLASLAYKNGASTNIEVVDAEQRARDADAQVAIAEDGSWQSRLDLMAGAGRFPEPIE
jgi:outer membrane protein TolC